MDENGYKINNIDITLICEKPKISKYKKNLKKIFLHYSILNLKMLMLKLQQQKNLAF